MGEGRRNWKRREGGRLLRRRCRQRMRWKGRKGKEMCRWIFPRRSVRLMLHPYVCITLRNLKEAQLEQTSLWVRGEIRCLQNNPAGRKRHGEESGRAGRNTRRCSWTAGISSQVLCQQLPMPSLLLSMPTSLLPSLSLSSPSPFSSLAPFLLLLPLPLPLFLALAPACSRSVRLSLSLNRGELPSLTTSHRTQARQPSKFARFFDAADQTALYRSEYKWNAEEDNALIQHRSIPYIKLTRTQSAHRRELLSKLGGGTRSAQVQAQICAFVACALLRGTCRLMQGEHHVSMH